MKTYELTYIVSPEITSEEAGAKGKEIESLITGKEGTVLKQINPVAKTLAHVVEKRASGFLGILEFQVEPEKLVELQTILSKDTKLVRYMVIIKQAAEFKKERRTRTKPTESVAAASQGEASLAPSEREQIIIEKPTKTKEKVELKDIEQSLDELLGE